MKTPFCKSFQIFLCANSSSLHFLFYISSKWKDYHWIQNFKGDSFQLKQYNSGSCWHLASVILSFFFFFFFCLLRAAPTVGSQARGRIGAEATCPHHSSWEYQVLNPLSETRDWTYVLIDASQICFCWATMGTPHQLFLSIWSTIYPMPPFSHFLTPLFFSWNRLLKIYPGLEKLES